MNATIVTILALGFLSALFFLALCVVAAEPRPRPTLNPHRRRHLGRFRSPIEPQRRFNRRRQDSNDNQDEDDVSGRERPGERTVATQ